MTVRRLTIPLDERACTLALGPYSPGCVLRPESRAAIERAHDLGIKVREVTCTSDEACDILNYFRSAAAALTMVIDPEGPFCSRARDNIRNVLRVAGIAGAGDRAGEIAQ
jgi:hypothetical protein